MKSKSFSMCLIITLVFMFFACSSKNDRLLSGKWTLAGQLVGGSPSSYWFKGGDVIAPWEDHNFALKSKGVYELINDKRIKIIIKSGYYEGNIYFFDIIKLTENEMIFRSNFQEVKFKRKG